MILEEKIKLFTEKKLLKNSTTKYFCFLFLSIFFLVITLILLIAINANRSKFLNYLNFKHIKNLRITIYLHIFFVTLIMLQIYWFINSLCIILINKYFKFNIFRAIKWLKIWTFCSLKFELLENISKPIENFTNEEIDLIKNMQENNLFLHGSKSIAYKYKDFWRKTNDMDFCSFENKLKNLDLNIKQNIKITFYDKITAKLLLNNKNIEVLIAKYIPNYFIQTKREIKIPKLQWMIAMKIHQLLKLFLIQKEGMKVSKEKIQNTFLDLAFLLNKGGKYNINKTILFIKYLYISNFFISYYLNKLNFSDYSEKNIKEFVEYCSNNIKQLENVNELYFFFDLVLTKLQNNQELIKMSKAMNIIIQEKEKLENKFLNYSTHENKNISSLERQFSSEKEKNDFLKTNYENLPITSKIIKLFNSNWTIGFNNKNNNIDIRQILLFELNKKIGDTNE